VNAESFAELVKARRAGRGRWMARCPAHEDGSPSLSISEGRDGRVLLNCFAGCRLTSILQALNLSLRDLFAGEPLTREQKALRETQQKAEAAEKAKQRRIRLAECDRRARLQALTHSLGAKLARTPEDDALTLLFHQTLDRLHNLEMSNES